MTSSLSAALNNALTGLGVSQQQLTITSENIANVNTPGYSRKVPELANNIVNGTGFGVKIEDVVRKVDQYLQVAAQQQNSVVSNASVANDYATRIQTLLGQPSSTTSTTTDTSIASAITGFFTSLQQLATTPTDASLQVSAVQSGQNLSNNMSTLATGLQGLRYQADQQVAQDIGTVNGILQKLQNTNNALAYAHNSGSDTADLLDQRDGELTQLSQYISITYYKDSNQEVHVTTNSGIPLVDGGQLYQLSYAPQSSVDAFTNSHAQAPINVYRIDVNGHQTGSPIELASAGVGSGVTTSITSGEIRGLLDIRDSQIPQMIDQLDNLASNIMDQVNAIHNSGSAYPGANSYVGQRQVSASQNTGWLGSVRIGLLDAQGQPLPSPYSGDNSGLPPLTLNLADLDTGNGAGYPTMQGIISAINSYYAPQNKASIGDLHNVQLVSDSKGIPGSPPQFKFDMNLENLSANGSSFFISNATVTDDQNNSVGAVTSTQPIADLATSNTFTTTAGSDKVTVALTAPITGLKEGDYVYLSLPSSGVDNLSPAELNGYFKVSNISGNTFQITTDIAAQNSTSANVSNVTAMPNYATVAAGDTTRTKNDGLFTADLSGNTTSTYYTVSLDIATQNADGTLSQGTIKYKVLNPATNIMNAPYGPQAATAILRLRSLPATRPWPSRSWWTHKEIHCLPSTAHTRLPPQVILKFRRPIATT